MPQRRLTHDELIDILLRVNCSVGEIRWCITTGTCGPDDGFYLQLRYLEPDITTGDPQDQHGRKWYISPYSTVSEVVQTALKACLTSAEHMVREHFTYRGVRVFNPHFDVENLAEIVGKTDVREPKGNS